MIKRPLAVLALAVAAFAAAQGAQAQPLRIRPVEGSRPAPQYDPHIAQVGDCYWDGLGEAGRAAVKAQVMQQGLESALRNGPDGRLVIRCDPHAGDHPRLTAWMVMGKIMREVGPSSPCRAIGFTHLVFRGAVGRPSPLAGEGGLRSKTDEGSGGVSG